MRMVNPCSAVFDAAGNLIGGNVQCECERMLTVNDRPSLMTHPPAAYELAKRYRRSLSQRYAYLSREFKDDGAKTRLRSFHALLETGCPAVNMNLGGVIRFLETGILLNMYEVVAMEIGKSSGREFVTALKKRLKTWYRPRRIFDRLLKFTHDTHYASLNLGSGGPDYGEFCVKFGPDTPLEFATCFMGDPLRYIFDSDGERVLENSDIFRRFATNGDRSQLAAVHCRTLLEKNRIIDRHSLIKVFDDRDSLLELHIHADLRRENVMQIAIQPDYYAKLCRKCIELESLSGRARQAETFTDARRLKRFFELVQNYGIVFFAESN